MVAGDSSHSDAWTTVSNNSLAKSPAVWVHAQQQALALWLAFLQALHALLLASHLYDICNLQ